MLKCEKPLPAQECSDSLPFFPFALNEVAVMSAKKSIVKGKNSSEKLANLQVSLARKKKCQAKALEVVETMLEDHVNKETFIDNCKFLNQSYYRDAIEERAVAMLCGYPLCSNKLQKIPTQKYRISTKYNKVFDIGERKHFCRNWCFKASKFLEMQLPSSPLWLLDEDSPVQVTLLDLDEKSEGMGEEICFVDNGVKQELKNFIESHNYRVSRETVQVQSNRASNRPENVVNVTSANDLTKAVSKVSLDEEPKMPSASSDCSLGESVSTAQQSPNRKKKQETSSTTSHKLVEQCLKEWFTVETLKFLLGPEGYRLAIESKGYSLDQLVESWGLQEACDRKAFVTRYKRLCSKLDVQEREDSDLDSELTQSKEDEIAKRKKKKLPSFEQLAEELEVQRLNVEAFYKGKTEVLTADGNLSKKLKDKGNEMHSKLKEDECDQQLSLPLVDSHSQNALRRRIVLDRLNRSCITLLQALNSSTKVEIASEMRQLVSTLNLQAYNITFKPAEWMLVALILINLLAIKDDALKNTVENETSQKCIAILLKSFLQDLTYLKRVSEWLMDVEHLIEKMNSEHK